MENEKIKGIIIACDKVRFVNKKSGEVSYMAKIRYCMPKEQTTNYLGYAELDSYNNVKVFDYCKDKDLFGKIVNLELAKVVDGNRLKLKIVKINDYVLS